jgi:hypothetical protein
MTTTEFDNAEIGTGANRTGLYLAILQLVFTLGWTTYVIYLPKLAAGGLLVGRRLRPSGDRGREDAAGHAISQGLLILRSGVFAASRRMVYATHGSRRRKSASSP